MSISVAKTLLWTKSITNDSLVISLDDGVKVVSVYNSSAVTGTVTGDSTVTVNGEASAAINVAEGETYTMPSIDGTAINELTITAPASCTLVITAAI